jgi:CspA family cold shock protein
MARGKTPAPDTFTGTVKSLHNDKGFGFLVDDNGVEYFFHRSACPAFDDLARGTAVRFTMTTGQKGPRAENVEVI